MKSAPCRACHTKPPQCRYLAAHYANHEQINVIMLITSQWHFWPSARADIRQSMRPTAPRARGGRPRSQRRPAQATSPRARAGRSPTVTASNGWNPSASPGAPDRRVCLVPLQDTQPCVPQDRRNPSDPQDPRGPQLECASSPRRYRIGSRDRCHRQRHDGRRRRHRRVHPDPACAAQPGCWRRSPGRPCWPDRHAGRRADRVTDGTARRRAIATAGCHGIAAPVRLEAVSVPVPQPALVA